MTRAITDTSVGGWISTRDGAPGYAPLTAAEAALAEDDHRGLWHLVSHRLVGNSSWKTWRACLEVDYCSGFYRDR